MSPTTRTGLIAFGIVGGVFLVVGLVVGVMVGRVGSPGEAGGDLFAGHKPRAERQGADWNQTELYEHLKRAGVRVSLSSQIPDGPNAVYYAGKGSHFLVTVRQYPTPREAHDAAPRDGFSWGRFAFSGDADTLAEIRKALGA